MCIIEEFSKYLNVSSLPKAISNSPELVIARKAKEIEHRIQDANKQLAAHASANKKGMTVIEEAIGTESLRQLIQSEGTRLEQLKEISSEMSEVLEAEGVESIAQLQERRADYQNTLQTAPRQAWQAFLLARGEGKYDASDRTKWLPSDLCNIPEFKAQEAVLRQQIEDAKATLEHITPALGRVEDLVEQARAI